MACLDTIPETKRLIGRKLKDVLVHSDISHFASKVGNKGGDLLLGQPPRPDQEFCHLSPSTIHIPARANY